MRAVLAVVESLPSNGVDCTVEAHFDESVGLVVNCTLSGEQSVCETLKAGLNELLMPYPFAATIEIA